MNIQESDIEYAMVTKSISRGTCSIEICFASKEIRQYFVSLEDILPNPIRIISRRDTRDLFSRAKSLKQHGFRVNHAQGRLFAIDKSENKIEILDDKDILSVVTNAVNKEINKTEEKYLQFIKNLKK